MVNGDEIRNLIDAHQEWLLVRDTGRAFPLLASEIEVTAGEEKTLFGFLDDGGFHSWRLNGYEFTDGELTVDVAGAFARKREKFRLVPRSSAAELAAEVEIARLHRANEFAEIVGRSFAVKVVRVELNTENGRLAHIYFEQGKQQSVALADVTDTLTPEVVLTTAILWLEKLGSRKRSPISELRIVAEHRQAKSLQKLHALLNDRWKAKLTIAEISRKTDPPAAKDLPKRRLSELWREKTRKLNIPREPQVGETAARLIALSPDNIDLVYSKQGETLRFMGLPFARVRSILNNEKAWFGTEKDRRALGPDNWNELVDLVRQLERYRSADSENRRHEHYRSSPEAWIESILRRDIRLLDANLILSPIYNQFRASNDKIDLLALRRDGRLVIIELKAQPDREMIFQAADYWRKIELQRRRGVLREANLFDGREIADRPALVYLAAPALSFHRDFEFFARTISSEIELWRFELHENWRREIKVLARREFRDQTFGLAKR